MLLLNSFKKSPIKDKVFKVIIKQNGITIDNVDILWKDVSRVLVENEGLLIYYHDNFIYMPKSAFEEKEYEKALQIIRSKGIKA